MATDPFWDDVALLIQGGGGHGSSTLVEAAGADITGIGTSPMTYSNASAQWASTSLYQPFSLSYRYRLQAVLGAAFTFDGWFNFAGSGTRYIFSNAHTGRTDPLFYIYRGGGITYLYTDGANRISYLGAGGWLYLRVTYDGAQWVMQVNDDIVGTYSESGLEFANENLGVFGLYSSTSGPFGGYAEDVRLTLGVAREGPAPTEAAATEGPPQPYSGPLQPPKVVAWNQHALASAPSVLGAPAVRAWNQHAIASAPSMLGAPSALAFTDFSASVSDIDPRYIMRITGDPVLEIPISSWQATLQTDRQTYLQCVIPAAGEYAADLAARRGVSELVVYRVVDFGGLQLESEMARAPLTTINSSSGPFRGTAVVSGYADAVQNLAERPVLALQGIRSVTQSLGSSTRIRCNIDWFLRPGQDVSGDGLTITAGFINYYVTSEGDAYMDVGTRG